MQKFYYVYILVDITTGTHHYTGVMEDLHARLAKHNAGEVPHTAKFTPWHIQTIGVQLPSVILWAFGGF
jgi:predicted GIY-YIG superfamily endonuclease